MRRPLAFALLLAACSDPGFAPSIGSGGEGVVTVPIHGAVYDSVTGATLAGVTVAIQGQFIVTDPNGRYDANVALGANQIAVATAGYERFARTVSVDPIRTFDLPLRRLAPFPTSCQLDAAGFTAVVIDLQGRKSLERWSQSTLTLVAPAGTRVIDAPMWGYLPLDTYRWEVSIGDADPATTRVDWKLYDSQGDLYRGSCAPSRVGTDSTTS